jgi:cytochrome P450
MLISVHRQCHVSELLDGFQQAETYRSALKTFFLAMVMFPETQKLAQQEIDLVLRGERLPDFGNRDTLPYVTALVMEVQRWHPVAPTSVPLETQDPRVMY